MKSQHDAPDLETHYDNLCYCCNDCNSHKGEWSLPDRLINDPLCIHLRFEPSGEVTPLTDEGKWLAEVLLLTHQDANEGRRIILDVRESALADLQASRNTPKLAMFEYPSALEPLSNLRPPINTRRNGIDESAWGRRERGILPRFY